MMPEKPVHSRVLHVRTRPWRSAFLGFLIATLGGDFVRAGSYALDHETKIDHDFGGQRMPQWTGGALVSFVSNPSASPSILGFDEKGKQLAPIAVAVPGSEKVDLFDVSRSADGTVVAVGAAYDQIGRGSGFFLLSRGRGDNVTLVRLYPYYAYRVAIGDDGTIWTAGMEVINGKDKGPAVNPSTGVVRHFDRTGKLLGTYIPRSTLSSGLVAQYGRLRSAKGRVGWYTGPISGPGSVYYEILSGGTVREYPAISLAASEHVTGLALTDDGGTYVTTSDAKNHTWRFLSTTAPEQAWTSESLPESITRSVLYGGEGMRLVFYTGDHRKITFVSVSR